jgi:alanyl-tRNA synthetase
MITEEELKSLKNKKKLLDQAAEVLKVEEKDLPRVVKRFLDEIKQFDERLKK